MPVTSPQKAAVRQAKAIETFWARRGHPDVRCVVIVDTDEHGGPVFGVRSNIDLSRLGAAPFTSRRC